jgi:hypothetical protein
MQVHTTKLFLQLIPTPLIKLASYLQVIIRQGFFFEWGVDMWCLIILNILVLPKMKER